MQIASIVFFVVCIGGLLISLGSLGKEISGILAIYAAIGIYAIVFYATIYDIWQTGYVIYLLFENVKRITAHQRSTQNDISRLGKSTGTDFSSVGMGSQLQEREKERDKLKILAKTDDEQAKLTKRIIVSSSTAFILQMTGIAMVFLASNYDANGKQTLFGSSCGQMIYVLGNDKTNTAAFHLALLCYILKQVQTLAISSITRPKTMPSTDIRKRLGQQKNISSVSTAASPSMGR
jgi:hypothetical protein